MPFPLHKKKNEKKCELKSTILSSDRNMSSSFRLYQRRRNPQAWTVPGDAQNHYVRPFGECAPGYTALPIGNPDGVKICSKSYPEVTKLPVADPEITQNKYYKFASRLYDPANPHPVQMRNPARYDQRFGPNQGFLLGEDYYKAEIKYDGIGGYPQPTAAPTALYEYGVSVLPDPPQFERNRLHQLGPLWEQDIEYHSAACREAVQPRAETVLGIPKSGWVG